MRRQDGYSLAEMTVAVAVFALAISVLFGGYTRAMRLWSSGRDRTEALANLRLAALWLGADARTAAAGSTCVSSTDCTLIGPTGTSVHYTFNQQTLWRAVNGGTAMPVATGMASVSLALPVTGASHRLLFAALQASPALQPGPWDLQAEFALRND